MTSPTSREEHPLVRNLDPETVGNLAEMLTPPTEETTPGPGTPRTSRRRSPSPRRTPTEAQQEAAAVDEESPIDLSEATGAAEWGAGEAESGPVPRKGSRTRTTRPTRAPRRPTRPSLSDVEEGFAGGDGTSDRNPTAAAVAALSDAAQPGASRRGDATAANWEEFLAVLFGFMSMLYMWWLVAGFEVSKPERDALMLQEDEADAFARPMARILARSWINRAYGKHVLGATDYVVLAIAVAEYAKRTAPYARRKASTYGPIRRRTTPVMQTGAATPGTSQETKNGHVDAAAARPHVVRPISAT